MSQEVPEEFRPAQALINALKNASEYGMEWEFLYSFFQDLKVTPEQVDAAIWHAYCEWDL